MTQRARIVTAWRQRVRTSACEAPCARRRDRPPPPSPSRRPRAGRRPAPDRGDGADPRADVRRGRRRASSRTRSRCSRTPPTCSRTRRRSALALVAVRLARRPAKGALTSGWRRVEVLAAPGERRHAAGARDPDRLRGGEPPGLAAARAPRPRAGGRAGGRRRQPRRDVGPHGRRPPQPRRRGQLPARADRPVRVHRHRGRGGRDPRERLRARRRDRVAARRRPDDRARATALVATSARMFLEAAPAGLDPRAIGLALAAQPAIVEVHDLHVWEVTSGFPALSAHVLVDPEATATGRAASSRRCSPSASASSTPRCRSTTPRSSCSRSSRPNRDKGTPAHVPGSGSVHAPIPAFR